MSPRSWRVGTAAFRTPALACAIVIALVGLAELGARLPWVRDVLKAPSVGSPSRRFETQLDGLERFASSDPNVDCIVLGNSTALMGVDPAALSDGYRSRTGRGLRCFNFGVGGMTASGVAAVAPILAERFRPRLLLYVVSVRDVGQSVDGPALANTPWVRYRHGIFSVEGWLAEHSEAFRYYLLYRQWLDPSRWPAVSASGAPRDGYLRVEAQLPLSPTLWEHTLRAYNEVARQPPSATEVAAFSRLLSLSREGMQVVVVEAPVHEELRRWASDTSFYRQATGELMREARQRHIEILEPPTERLIPSDGWLDYVHLRAPGAAAFSEWLGARIAASLGDGSLAAPPDEAAAG